MTSQAYGYVYVLTNPSIPGLLEIGVSEEQPEHRARTLSRHEGVPSPFDVAFSVRVDDGAQAEHLVHGALAMYRTTQDRAFFQLSVSKAREIIQRTLEAMSAATSDDAQQRHSHVGACPMCGARVAFVRSLRSAVRFCVNGHVVRLDELLRAAENAPSPSPRVADAAATGGEAEGQLRTQLNCGICGKQLVSYTDGATGNARCPGATCFRRFPRTYPLPVG